MGLQRGCQVKVWVTKRVFPFSFCHWEGWSRIKASATFRVTANARCETKPKVPVGAGSCKGAAYRMFGQRKGQGWRSLCKAQPLATIRVRIRVRRKTKTQVLLWWGHKEFAKGRAEQQKDFSPESFSTWAITQGLVLNLSQR